MSQATAPYGEWSSPISGDSFVARSVTLSQVRVDGPDTYWVEGHPLAGGRNTLLRRNRLGQTSEVLPMIDGVRLPDVRTRVHEYGGRAYAVNEGFIVFSDGHDGRLYSFDFRDPAARIIPLTPLENVRYGDIELAEVRGVVYAVREDHRGEGEPINSLVSIPLDGSAARDGSQILTIFEGSDFCMAPSLSTDGSKLAWLTWDHPDMPWTHSILHVAGLSFEGTIDSHVVLVDEPGVCVYEPRWTLDGDLIHVDDSSGWANLYRTEGFAWLDGEEADAWTTRLRTRALHPGSRAFSHPHWRLGLHSYDNFNNDMLICSWKEGVTWRIGTVRLDNGLSEEWQTGWWPIGNVACADDRVVFLGDSATHSPAIIEIRNGHTTVIRPSSEAEVEAGFVSTAEAISWETTDGEKAHGFFYAPSNPHYIAPEGDLPPLIVHVHGGPTTASRPGLQVPFQFWTSRGFAVLDVNYRGSTGFGRTYRERLNGNWGIMDVADCESGVEFLAAQGLIDPQRVAIRGGSAGGFTTLSALAHSDVFSAGTSFFGVADLRALAQETHKFESHYIYALVGSHDLSEDVWTERSPLHQIGKVTAPLLLLQGSDDAVVPPSQTTAMHEALLSQGKATLLRIYDGEGHGFRKAENIQNAWETELSFYGKVWGLHPDGAVDLEIPHL